MITLGILKKFLAVIILVIFVSCQGMAVTLSRDTVDLDEVVVEAKAPQVKWEGPTMTVDIQANQILKERTAFDILNLLPGVAADYDGNVTVNGKSLGSLIVNGRKVRMHGQQLAMYLKTLRGVDLKDIEIQTLKTAADDAASGEVTIKISRLKHLNTGYGGWIGAGYDRSKRNSFNENGQFSFYTPKVSLYANLSMTESSDHTDNTMRETTNSFEYLTKFSGKSDRVNIMPCAGLDYDISSDHYLGLEWQGNFSNPDFHYFTDMTKSVPDEISKHNFSQIENSRRRSDNNNITANYNWKLDSLYSKFSVNADWLRYASDVRDHFTVDNHGMEPDESLYQPSDEKINMLTIQADLLKSIGKWYINTGLKFSDVRTKYFKEFFKGENDNMLLQEGDVNNFRYRENIGAIYLNANFNTSSWILSMGVRGEYTNAESRQLGGNASAYTRQYFDIFPYLGVYRKINGTWIGITYSKSITRPQYMFVNPFRSYLTELSYVEGNPDLKPGYMRSVSVNTTIKGRYGIYLTYQSAKDMVREQYFVDDEDRTYRTFVNCEDYDRVMLSLSCPIRTGIWTSNNMVGVEWARKNWDKTVKCSWYYSLSTVNTLRFNDHWNTVLSLKFWPKEKGLYMESMLNRLQANAEFSYSFLKYTMNLQFGVRDIFNSEGRFKAMFHNEEMTNFTEIKRSTGRTFFVSLTYYFSKGLKKKNIRKERTNDDERNRM